MNNSLEELEEAYVHYQVTFPTKGSDRVRELHHMIVEELKREIDTFIRTNQEHL